MRTNERPNRFAGRCLYCRDQVAEGAGFVFDDILNNRRNAVRHSGCNEATAIALKDAKAESAWDAALGGKAAPTRKPTLEEAFEAGKDADVFPEAEELHGMLAHALAEATDAIADKTAAAWLERIPDMVAELLASHRHVSVQIGDMPTVKVGVTHKDFEDVLLMVVAGASPLLVGPAGSGKTTLCEQVAKALGRNFYMSARITSEYKLLGFIDAHGNYVRTQFRDAYEHGGLFLLDEMDASDPDALTTFNAGLAGKQMDFPDGMVQRHADFSAIAAANTFGRGADRQYVGRNQLDAATLDRFQPYAIDYDEPLETRIAGNKPWSAYVQAIRFGVDGAKVRHVVSPRASIEGAKLLAAGMEVNKVIEACIWKGLDQPTRDRVANGTSAGAIRLTYQALLRSVATDTEEEAA